MKRAAKVTPALQNFRIEDAEETRQHNPTIDKLLNYFEAKTGGTRLVRRSDLNPMELTQELPQIGMFGPIYNDEGLVVDVNILLLGSRLDQFYGAMTGKRATDYNNLQVADRVIGACKQVVESRKPMVIHAEAMSEKQTHLSVKVLYVPMSNDGEVIDRIFVHNQISSNYDQDGGA